MFVEFGNPMPCEENRPSFVRAISRRKEEGRLQAHSARINGIAQSARINGIVQSARMNGMLKNPGKLRSAKVRQCYCAS